MKIRGTATRQRVFFSQKLFCLLFNVVETLTEWLSCRERILDTQKSVSWHVSLGEVYHFWGLS